MSRTIIVQDVQPVTITISRLGDGRLILACRYERLDESGEAIPEFAGNINREVRGARKEAILGWIANNISPYLREVEGIT